MKTEARIPTNLRTIMILEVLGKSERALTATEINEELKLPKQTVHRLCTTLEKNGFLSRVGNSKRFQPARRLRDLGNGLMYTSRDHIARRQILAGVAREIRETVNYVVPQDNGMSYLDRVEADWAFRIQLPIGSQVPFHCTASGKCFMASLGPKARQKFVSALALERWTAATHTDPERLLAELGDIAKQGYSVDRQEFMDGMVAIAVPVTDPGGRFVAALAVHGPTPRIVIEEAIERRDVLRAAAAKLTDTLFVEPV